ncbi:MAG: SDR family oxidoreductase [Rhodobacteraceae bacterium]|nr:SDR family oxidoreductase [Paracoccaceae bacterium]
MRRSGPAFITGGSSGIGLALAAELAGRGHPVALFARDAARLQDAVRELRADHPDVIVTAYPLDVSDRAAVDLAVARAIADHGAPGWAIANAGIAEPGNFLDQDITRFEAQMQVNYMGALYFAKAVAPAMAELGGRLVFVASGAAFFGIHGYAAYAPTKFALRGLAEVLRVELKPHRISVALAYPPDTDTAQLAHEQQFKPAATRAITAGGGLWQPQDVASLIVRRAARGRFAVAPGFQMQALLSLHSLLAPLLRRWQDGLVRKHHGR